MALITVHFSQLLITIFKRTSESSPQLFAKHFTIFTKRSEAEMIFYVFDLFHHVTNLLSLFSEDILHSLLLMGIK